MYSGKTPSRMVGLIEGKLRLPACGVNKKLGLRPLSAGVRGGGDLTGGEEILYTDIPVSDRNSEAALGVEALGVTF